MPFSGTNLGLWVIKIVFKFISIRNGQCLYITSFLVSIILWINVSRVFKRVNLAKREVVIYEDFHQRGC